MHKKRLLASLLVLLSLDVDFSHAAIQKGVEAQAQVNCLCSLGVDYLQGFYFGRPEKVDTFCCEYR